VRGGHGWKPYRLTTRALQQVVAHKKWKFSGPPECRTSVLLDWQRAADTARRRAEQAAIASAA
jgi:hypothetical protein